MSSITAELQGPATQYGCKYGRQRWGLSVPRARNFVATCHESPAGKYSSSRYEVLRRGISWLCVSGLVAASLRYLEPYVPAEVRGDVATKFRGRAPKVSQCGRPYLLPYSVIGSCNSPVIATSRARGTARGTLRSASDARSPRPSPTSRRSRAGSPRRRSQRSAGVVWPRRTANQ